VKVSKPTKAAPISQEKAGCETRQKSAYGRYLDSVCLPTPEGEYTSEAISGMQHAMLDLLRSEEPIPDEMRRHLSLAFEYLCAGFEFDLVTPIRKRGGREMPIAKHFQECGIRYLRWCEETKITDSIPTSTVATAFGVSTKTVGVWYKKWGDKSTPPLFDEWGAAQVKKFMEISGTNYQRLKMKLKTARETP
jgi:hypothetical protein